MIIEAAFCHDARAAKNERMKELCSTLIVVYLCLPTKQGGGA